MQNQIGTVPAVARKHYHVGISDRQSYGTAATRGRGSYRAEKNSPLEKGTAPKARRLCGESGRSMEDGANIRDTMR